MGRRIRVAAEVGGPVVAVRRARHLNERDTDDRIVDVQHIGVVPRGILPPLEDRGRIGVAGRNVLAHVGVVAVAFHPHAVPGGRCHRIVVGLLGIVGEKGVLRHVLVVLLAGHRNRVAH